MMQTAQRTRLRAFTIVELLVVIGIIAILVTIVFGVAAGVRNSANRQLTETALAGLESMLEEYIGDTGRIPAIPKRFLHYRQNDFEDFYRFPREPLTGPDEERIFGVAAFLRQARGIGSVDTILGGLPERLVVRRGAIEAYIGPAGVADFEGTGFEQEDERRAPTILDGWGHEIYYLHPAVRPNPTLNLSADFRIGKRFGVSQSGRPFFMSVGPDGRAGDRESGLGEQYLQDNVYSTQPTGVYDDTGEGGHYHDPHRGANMGRRAGD